MKTLRCLTIPQVAKVLKVSRSAVYNLMNRSEIPFIEVTRNRRPLRP